MISTEDPMKRGPSSGAGRRLPAYNNPQRKGFPRVGAARRRRAVATGLPEPHQKAIMSTLTIQLPESLKKNIEALAAREGYTVSQFLASAAGDKLAVRLTPDYLRPGP